MCGALNAFRTADKIFALVFGWTTIIVCLPCLTRSDRDLGPTEMVSSRCHQNTPKHHVPPLFFSQNTPLAQNT